MIDTEWWLVYEDLYDGFYLTDVGGFVEAFALDDTLDEDELAIECEGLFIVWPDGTIVGAPTTVHDWHNLANGLPAGVEPVVMAKVEDDD